MESESIIQVLGQWNFWKKDHDTGVLRETYLKRIKQLIQTGQIVAITGVRRSGKSTIAKQFIQSQIREGKDPKNFLYVNLEETRFSGSLSPEFLQRIYDAYIEIVKPDQKSFVILDEVQEVNGWERFVRGLHERNEAQVLVTGSTSNLLSKELGTLLSGRWVELKVYPLTFSEFLGFRGIKVDTPMEIATEKTRIKQNLREYLEFGGLPNVTLKEDKDTILQGYLNDILVRDVVTRHRIRKPDKVKALAQYYLTNFAKLHSHRSISKFIGISLDSVERFSAYFQEAGLIFFMPKFSYSLKEQEVNLKKVYGIDTGIINQASFRFSENLGRLFENAVFLSLERSGMEVYYHKKKFECDFLVKKGQKIARAIQVSYQLDENKDRELRGLLEALQEFGLKEGLIVTGDQESVEQHAGKTIRTIPLWKWLLLEFPKDNNPRPHTSKYPIGPPHNLNPAPTR